LYFIEGTEYEEIIFIYAIFQLNYIYLNCNGGI